MIIKLLVIFLFVYSLHPVHADTPGNSETVSYGFGFEGRGISGIAAASYDGLLIERPLYTLESIFALDVIRWDYDGIHPPTFRSFAFEAGTGSAILKEFHVILRMQLEQFSASSSTLFSFFPRVLFDSGHVFISSGINFRLMTIDDLQSSSDAFNHLEKQFMFSFGGRLIIVPRVSASAQISNFDEYMAGSFATIGYTAGVTLKSAMAKISAFIGYRPSGSIALASCPSSWIARLIIRKEL